jgi:hypothetical protein
MGMSKEGERGFPVENTGHRIIRMVRDIHHAEAYGFADLLGG